jgi:hypothetical protein
LLDAETQVYAFKQLTLANNEYYEKFKDLVTNAERSGSDIGAHSDRIDTILEEIATDPDMPTMSNENRHAIAPRISFLPSCFSSTVTMPATGAWSGTLKMSTLEARTPTLRLLVPRMTIS